MSLRFVLPLPPNRGNARGHTRWMNRAKKDYFDALSNIAAYGRSAAYGDGDGVFDIPLPPAVALPKAKASAHLYVWNFYDDDGAAALMKWPMDWLVRNGYLADDKRKVLRWTGYPEQTIDRAARRIELTLEAA